MTDNPNPKNIKSKVKETLAMHLGLDTEDINDEDSLEHDLHMHASDFSDIFSKLEEKGLDTSKVNFAEIDTVSDLIENLGNDEYL